MARLGVAGPGRWRGGHGEWAGSGAARLSGGDTRTVRPSGAATVYRHACEERGTGSEVESEWEAGARKRSVSSLAPVAWAGVANVSPPQNHSQERSRLCLVCSSARLPRLQRSAVSSALARLSAPQRSPPNVAPARARHHVVQSVVQCRPPRLSPQPCPRQAAAGLPTPGLPSAPTRARARSHRTRRAARAALVPRPRSGRA